MTNIGDKLRYAREQAGYSVTKTAKKMDIGPAMLAYFESGKVEPTASQLSRLARIYHRTTYFFLDDNIGKDADLVRCEGG